MVKENWMRNMNIREQGKLDPVIGREEEIRRTVQVSLEWTEINKCWQMNLVLEQVIKTVSIRINITRRRVRVTIVAI
jgi:hypothetical protein